MELIKYLKAPLYYCAEFRDAAMGKKLFFTLWPFTTLSLPEGRLENFFLGLVWVLFTAQPRFSEM